MAVIKLSDRTDLASAPNALAKAEAARRAAGDAILDLTVSNPTRVGLPRLASAALEALAVPEAAHYTPHPFGLPSARAAVAAVESARGPRVDSRRVMLTASTSEAYSFLFKTLCDPGDEVLAPLPSYPLFEHLAAFEGVKLTGCQTVEDDGWQVDVGLLRAQVTPRTRAILVVSPNNPTGAYLKTQTLEALAELGLPLIVDEVFWPYALTEDPDRISAAQQIADRAVVISLGGLSKLCALPQMKVGWLIVGGPDAAVAPLLTRLEWVSDTFLSLSAPVQHALPTLLSHRFKVHEAVRARLLANLAFARSVFRGSTVEVGCPDGGWYLTLRLPAILTEEMWAMALLGVGVKVQPGYFYDFAGGTRVVLSLLTPETDFELGCEAIHARVEREIL